MENNTTQSDKKPQEIIPINHDDNDSQINNSPDNKGLKSAPSVALPTMIDEYTKERERSGILENKAIALITILLALVTVYMPIIPFNKVKMLFISGTRIQLVILSLLSFIFLSTIILIGICFNKLISILKITTYKRVDLDEILEDDSIALEKDEYELALCRHYRELIYNNSKCNQKKADKLENCFVFTIFSFFLLLLVCLGMLII